MRETLRQFTQIFTKGCDFGCDPCGRHTAYSTHCMKVNKELRLYSKPCPGSAFPVPGGESKPDGKTIRGLEVGNTGLDIGSN